MGVDQNVEAFHNAAGLVRYDNRLNNVSFSTLTSLEINVFFMAIAEAIDRGSAEVCIDYAEIAKAANLPKSNPSYIFSLLQSSKDKICALNLRNLSEEQMYDDTIWLFSRWQNSGTDKTLTIVFSPYYTWLINGIKKNFTAFELKELVGLKGRAAKSLYVHLKQWKRTGRFILPLTQTRGKLGIPETCPDRNLGSKYMEPAVEELRSRGGGFANLRMEPVKSGSNHKLTGFVFTWDAELPDGSLPVHDMDDEILFSMGEELITRLEYNQLLESFPKNDVDMVIANIMAEEKTGYLNQADVANRCRKLAAEAAFSESRFYPPSERLVTAMSEYMNMRSLLGDPISKGSLDAAVRELERLAKGDCNDASAIIDRATSGGWKGFYPLPEEERHESVSLAEKWGNL